MVQTSRGSAVMGCIIQHCIIFAMASATSNMKIVATKAKVFCQNRERTLLMFTFVVIILWVKGWKVIFLSLTS